jgi:hypothetical protein
MTLSKAEWRAVRPDKLRNLDAAKLMEALRRKPGDSIEDWQDFLEKCDDLQATLDRTPRMLLKTMTRDFAAALEVWYRDIADLRREGSLALEDLGRACVDAACTQIARPVTEAAQALVETLRATIKAEKKRPLPDRDRRLHGRLTDAIAATHGTIRALRRDKMKMPLKDYRQAQEMIRGRHVRMGRFRMSCDPVLKGLLRALGDLQKQYDKLMVEAPRSRGAAPE